MSTFCLDNDGQKQSSIDKAATESYTVEFNTYKHNQDPVRGNYMSTKRPCADHESVTLDSHRNTRHNGCNCK